MKGLQFNPGTGPKMVREYFMAMALGNPQEFSQDNPLYEYVQNFKEMLLLLEKCAGKEIMVKLEFSFAPEKKECTGFHSRCIIIDVYRSYVLVKEFESHSNNGVAHTLPTGGGNEKTIYYYDENKFLTGVIILEGESYQKTAVVDDGEIPD